MPDDGVLRGRRAVVADASTEIGAAIGAALLDAGATVVLLDPSADGAELAERVRRGSGNGGSSSVVPVPGADPAGLRRAAEVVTGRLGGVDLVVVPAGTASVQPFESLDGVSTDLGDRALLRVLAAARAFMGGLLSAAASGTASDLLLIGSVASQHPAPLQSVHAATAAGVAQLARSLRAEVGGRGVRVSCIEPAAVGPSRAHPTSSEPGAGRRWRGGQAPSRRGRGLVPEDVAAAAVFTSSLPLGVNLAEMTVVPTAESHLDVRDVGRT